MKSETKDAWTVEMKIAGKSLGSKDLPKQIQARLDALVLEMRRNGPAAKGWKNFSVIKGNKSLFHCHLSGGSPTYVACWASNTDSKRIEVFYVGTHKKAPY